MKYRRFGNTDLMVSEISLGCNKLGKSLFNNVSEKESLRVLHQAFDQGINLFDTAPTYSYGDTEQLIGKAFRKQRDKVFFVTKAGRLASSLARYSSFIRPISRVARPILKPFKKKLKKASTPHFDFSQTWIEESLQNSLKRLKTNYVDVFLLHNPSIEVLQKGEVFEVLEKLKKAGQIRFYGVSIDTFEEAMLALQYPISCLQISFNLIQQAMAYQLFEEKEAIQDVGIMVKTPFLRGLLTSKKSLQTEYFDENTAQQIMKKNDALALLANNRAPSHVALQFLLHHSQVSTVLCGTTSTTHLTENLNYAQIKSLTDTEISTIREIQKLYPI